MPWCHLPGLTAVALLPGWIAVVLLPSLDTKVPLLAPVYGPAEHLCVAWLSACELPGLDTACSLFIGT